MKPVSVNARLYAIGDIHGCAQELSVLLDYLRVVERLTTEDTIVFIGDYIDRGPDTPQVIELLLQFQRSYPGAVFLKGNHEAMLLSYLMESGDEGNLFRPNGGEETLHQYGVLDPDHESALAKIPDEHLHFFLSLRRYFLTERYLFVHAGINPNLPLYQQGEDDLLWIRDEFLVSEHNLEKTVIFGHTPFETVFLDLPYKIGIDTGLVFGNKLSCVELTGERTFEVPAGGQEIKQSSFES